MNKWVLPSVAVPRRRRRRRLPVNHARILHFAQAWLAAATSKQASKQRDPTVQKSHVFLYPTHSPSCCPLCLLPVFSPARSTLLLAIGLMNLIPTAGTTVMHLADHSARFPLSARDLPGVGEAGNLTDQLQVQTRSVRESCRRWDEGGENKRQSCVLAPLARSQPADCATGVCCLCVGCVRWLSYTRVQCSASHGNVKSYCRRLDACVERPLETFRHT